MRIKNGFMKRKIGDKYLVVTTGELSRKENMFIEMNETSSEIWDLISKGCNSEEIAQALCEKYKIDREKAQADVNKLITSMKEAGVFEDE